MDIVSVENIHSRLHIRQACPEDVPFVAQCVLAAVDLCDFRSESVEKSIAEKVCGRDDTLYSYLNARIATLDGKPIGCSLSYDGAIYPEARPRTFRFFEREGRPMVVTSPETGPGEYYLDSMAVVPEYRGLGIGHLLMDDAVSIALSRGFSKVTLLVSCSKPRLQEYYAVKGFVPDCEMDAFGDRYLKMYLYLLEPSTTSLRA